MDLWVRWETLLWAGTVVSLAALVATALGVPWVVARLPADYFSRPRREAWRHTGREPAWALVVGFAKNTLGGLLLLLGAVMLVTPGQGVLTLLAGLLLMNFPGKYGFERWLVRRRGVLRALNWLRRRRGRRPFEAPADGG